MIQKYFLTWCALINHTWSYVHIRGRKSRNVICKILHGVLIALNSRVVCMLVSVTNTIYCLGSIPNHLLFIGNVHYRVTIDDVAAH